MRSSTLLCTLWVLKALANPVHEARNLPDDVASHQHNHLEFHVHKPRHNIVGRSLSGGSPGQDTSPQEDHSPTQVNPPVSQDKSSPIEEDTPAEKVIDELDTLFGESIGTGPCDDWAGNPDGQICQQQQQSQQPQRHPAQDKAQESHSPVQAPKKHVKIVDETVTVVVTQTVGEFSPLSTTPSASSGPPVQHKQAVPESKAQPQQEGKPKDKPQAAAKQEQPKPSPQPPSPAKQPEAPKQAQPKQQEAPKQEHPIPQEQPKPQPVPQSQPKQQENKPQPETQEKPQPTKEQPPADRPSGSGVNTDGLPLEYVDDLDCHDEIFKGLSKLHHDIHRTNHSLPLLVWNDTLFEYAKETAESCIYGHSLAPGGGGYGQNIAAGNAPGNISAVLTNGFYNAELELFKDAIAGEWGCDTPAMTNFEEWGHFTQMVWEGTTSFACYTATCSPSGADPLQCNPSTGQSYLKNVGCGNGGTKAYNTVCNYYPPGNFAGKYSSVPAPQDVVGFVQMTHNGVVGL